MFKDTLCGTIGQRSRHDASCDLRLPPRSSQFSGTISRKSVCRFVESRSSRSKTADEGQFRRQIAVCSPVFPVPFGQYLWNPRAARKKVTLSP